MRASAALLVAAVGLGVATLVSVRAQAGPAVFVRSLHDPAQRRETRGDILDTPVLPGSVMKAVTLVAALESQVIEPETGRMCRRTIVAAGKTYTCSHPDLKRPLLPVEALAHSCNSFFVSLAPRLTRAAFNEVRLKLGLPPVSVDANLPASFVGLDGPRLTPRALLDVVARLAGVDPLRPVAIGAEARQVLRDGLRGAAEYGSASSFRAAGVSALAKTGTAPMPGGSWMGLVVALTPADKPTRGIVVVAPGVAGADAAAIAVRSLAERAATSESGLGAVSTPTTAAVNAQDAAATAANDVRGSRDVIERPAVRSVRVSIKGRVNTLELEEYVARVIAGEGQPKAAEAAQQALAIAARTFAVANLNRHRRERYDLCDTTHCQVLRPSIEVTRRAARQTAGQVLIHQGQPATVFYSAWCGGRSELASEVWPGAVDYASRPHDDEACRGEPGWTSQLQVRDIERALRTAGYRGDQLRDLRIVDRNASGRVSRLRLTGFAPNEISGHDFRMAIGRIVGWQHLKSTAFDVERVASGYRFTGAGYGHGVGLCVVGAGNRAARGAGVDDILRFYFPTLRVGSYRTGAAPAPPPAMGTPDVLLALPSSEESERARLLQLVRDARTDIARQAAVKPPAVIRVTVHPTVEAFARATGQPWWVSGATEGTTIDLLPLAILRQRGQIERTIRHEVAHVLIDAELKGRPLWVREGGAFYFADPSGEDAPAARAGCPTDAEFLRPLSAGAHRAAYARAEACFRRAIAQGRRWQDVR